MITEELRIIEDLFYAALPLGAGERAELLATYPPSVREEVLALIEEDQRGSMVSRAVRGATQSLAESKKAAPEMRPGGRVGAYEIREEIGSGGMGRVFLGARADETYQRLVAIKFVRSEVDTGLFRERFERERRILGRLDHPYIARLLDAGSMAGGQPYFVMEYVSGGKPITEYAKHADLSTIARVELFAKVCEAVQYAHQNLTVHRDLKPGNILIDDTGCPKLLDFGIAKLMANDGGPTDQTIAAGIRMLTPDYASPEHTAGSAVTTAADIYSLGAVLYQVLTGLRPPRLTEDQQEIDPPRFLGADLGGILRMAMHRDPARRYATANDLRDDLLRHLQGQAIRARSYRWWERSIQFAKTYRSFLAATLVIAYGLAGAAVLSLRSANRAEQARHEAIVERNRAEESRQRALRLAAEAERQRRSAETERNTARLRTAETFHLTSQLIRDLQDKIERLPGAVPARAESINVAIQYLESLGKDPSAGPEVHRERALAYIRLGELQGRPGISNLDEPKAALVSFAKAEGLLQSPLLKDDPARLRLLVRLRARQAEVYGQLRDDAEERRALQDGLRIGRDYFRANIRLDSSAGVPVGQVLVAAGLAAQHRQEYQEALAYSAECLQVVAKADPTPFVRDLISGCWAVKGRAYGGLKDFQNAVPALREAIQIREELVHDEPSNAIARRMLMLAYSHLAAYLGSPSLPSLGDLPGALEAMKKVEEHAAFTVKANPWDTVAQKDLAISKNRRGDLLMAAKQFEEAHATFAEAAGLLDSATRSSPADLTLRTEVAFARKRLADSAVQLKKPDDEVFQLYRKALSEALFFDTEKRVIPSGYSMLMELRLRVATLSLERGDSKEAETQLTKLVELAEPMARNRTQPNSVGVRSMISLAASGDTWEKMGKRDRALKVRQTALEIWRTSSPERQQMWSEKDRAVVQAKMQAAQ
jgi:tetratricopeptide (TPR) repeat protein